MQRTRRVFFFLGWRVLRPAWSSKITCDVRPAVRPADRSLRPSGREDRGQVNEAPLRYHVLAVLIAGLLVSFSTVLR